MDSASITPTCASVLVASAVLGALSRWWRRVRKWWRGLIVRDARIWWHGRVAAPCWMLLTIFLMAAVLLIGYCRTARSPGCGVLGALLTRKGAPLPRFTSQWSHLFIVVLLLGCASYYLLGRAMLGHLLS